MANTDTNFTSRVTAILAAWLNPVNKVVYRLLGNSSGAAGTGDAPTTRAEIRDNLGFTSAGTTPGASLIGYRRTGVTTGQGDGMTVQQMLSQVVYPEIFFLAGETDDTAMIQRAINYIRNNQVSGSRNFFRLVFGNFTNKSYTVSACLDLTNMEGTHFEIDFNGSVLSFTFSSTNQNCLDLTGSRNVLLRNGDILGVTSGSFKPAFGILHARNNTGDSAARNKLCNMQIKGVFTQAAYMNYGSEQTLMDENCQIDNTFDNGGNTALGYGFGIAFDTDNDLGAASIYTTINTGGSSGSFPRVIGLECKNASPHGSVYMSGTVGGAFLYCYFRNKGSTTPETIFVLRNGCIADIIGFNIDATSSASTPNYLISLATPSGMTGKVGEHSNSTVTMGANSSVNTACWNLGNAGNPKIRECNFIGGITKTGGGSADLFAIGASVQASSRITGSFWAEDMPVNIKEVGLTNCTFYLNAMSQFTFDNASLLNVGQHKCVVQTPNSVQKFAKMNTYSSSTSHTITLIPGEDQIILDRANADTQANEYLDTIAFTGGATPQPGQELTIYGMANNGRNVTIQHNTGNIKLQNAMYIQMMRTQTTPTLFTAFPGDTNYNAATPATYPTRSSLKLVWDATAAKWNMV